MSKLTSFSFLEGKYVRLRALEASDTPVLAKWLNDEGVTHYMFYGQRPWSEPQVAEHFQQLVNSSAHVVFMLIEKSTKKPIGFAGLFDIHPTARKAEFRILIGEKTFWGKGRGTEVTRLLNFYGFDRLNLHRIYLGVTGDNQAGVKSYEKAGFIREGVLKEDIYRNSRYYDSVRMGLLRADYYRGHYKNDNKEFGSKI